MSEQEELFPQFPPLPALAFKDGTSSGFSGTDTSERNHMKVYVMPYNTNGRLTEKQGRAVGS